MKSFHFDPASVAAGSALRRALPRLVEQRYLRYDPHRRARLNDLVFGEVVREPSTARLPVTKNWLERAYPDGTAIRLRNERIVLGECIAAVGNRYAPPYLVGGLNHPITGAANGEVTGGSVLDALFGFNAVGYINHFAFPEERARVRINGVLVDERGDPVNLARFRETIDRSAPQDVSKSSLIVVAGHSTDAGKTTCAWAIASELRRRGFRVTVEKKSGTACCRDWLRCSVEPGTGALDHEGDEFSFTPAAFPARDFVDALGVVSDVSIDTNTFVTESVKYTEALLARSRPDFHVVELADSISHVSNAALLRTPFFQRRTGALIYAGVPSHEAAAHCLAYVRSLGLIYTPLVLSGPLANEDRHVMAREEIRERLGLPVCRSAVSHEGRWMPAGDELVNELLQGNRAPAGRRRVGV